MYLVGPFRNKLSPERERVMFYRARANCMILQVGSGHLAEYLRFLQRRLAFRKNRPQRNFCFFWHFCREQPPHTYILAEGILTLTSWLIFSFSLFTSLSLENSIEDDRTAERHISTQTDRPVPFPAQSPESHRRSASFSTDSIMSFRGGGRGGAPGGRGGFSSRGGRGGFGGGGRGGYANAGPPETVQPMGSFLHAVEGEMLCQSTDAKHVPYFNAPI